MGETRPLDEHAVVDSSIRVEVILLLRLVLHLKLVNKIKNLKNYKHKLQTRKITYINTLL